MSNFNIVTGYKPKKPIDLPLPISNRPSTSVESFAQHLPNLNEHFCQHRVCIENFPLGTMRKLHAQCMGAQCMDPYIVLKKVGEFVIPHNLGINPVFDVEDLILYRASFDYPALNPNTPSSTSP